MAGYGWTTVTDGIQLGAQRACGLRADDSVRDQAVVRLEVDHARLGDRAVLAVGRCAGLLLDHLHVVTLHEGRRQTQVAVEPGRGRPTGTDDVAELLLQESHPLHDVGPVVLAGR